MTNLPICNQPAEAAGPSRNLAVNLMNIWSVQADASYDVRCTRPRRVLITIRTREGAGRLKLEGRPPIVLPTGSLITLEYPRLKRYNCTDSNWTFWWFEYTTADPFPMVLNSPYHIEGDVKDATDFRETFTKLQHPSAAQRSIASATFSLMLHRWFAEIRLQHIPSPHRAVIEAIIDRIHANLSSDWTLSRLTAEAGLGETLFRREFRKATGLAPARFIRIARLHAAAQMIEQGTYTLAAIAEQLNFSSPFHLSAAFKQQFGTSPSARTTGCDASP